ncbi:uracil-DNA glycosylase family protein [Gluconobacter kanchanaburiensis]|uniref:Uracil-DNA glycosylase n=1 Tax=Gluconobacter kanchanaburiensis NBRC 103587 TaxID=1307948 RepID=A0A511B3W2_9PROT|nr:uracil-DNA glycosylase family protein [Gluconobacter kanchanaburiensis]MBF0860709.1 uracil-DNA glycosylase family protein [Gluconobacter kanchanaburiensis]GBR69645.1 uracil-DNA glycosylase [Gluconobacter kanchanaburiensis NBRC 103587]GEK95114.1 uracil-DNA glycosylase [Gluconobacter kanchanaburiensis NBRC 103587]
MTPTLHQTPGQIFRVGVGQTDADTGRRLGALEQEVRACRVCEPHLPLGARPLIQVSPMSRILIASQAPGTKAHIAGKSFYDPSGNRLRTWLDLPEEVFYDASRVAILPMGLCYPGRLPNGGDKPPRPECAPLWRRRILSLMPNLRLILLVGSYSQNYHLGRGSVTDRVRNFRQYLPEYFPLPHPSWRTGVWERKAPWFQEDVIPALRERMHTLMAEP